MKIIPEMHRAHLMRLLIQRSLGASKPIVLNRIAKTCLCHLCLREENLKLHNLGNVNSIKANLISHIIVEALTTERMIHSGTKSNMHLDKLTTIAKPRMIP
jgi:hypothetical protein